MAVHELCNIILYSYLHYSLKGWIDEFMQELVAPPMRRSTHDTTDHATPSFDEDEQLMDTLQTITSSSPATDPLDVPGLSGIDSSLFGLLSRPPSQMQSSPSVSPSPAPSSPPPPSPSPSPPREKKRRAAACRRTLATQCSATGRRKSKGKGKETTLPRTNEDPEVAYPDFGDEYGPTISLTVEAKPIDFFAQTYPTDLIDVIVEQSNLYANQKGVPGWEDTSNREIEAFLGFMMATSVHRLPQLRNYWSGDWVLGVPSLASLFPRDRFWGLWSNLHLADNTLAPPRDDPQFDKQYKVRPILNILEDAFRMAHKPSQQVAVDEAMVKFQGRSSLKQYMPLKPIKRGFKIWCLCDANSGYLHEFQIYTGNTL